MSGREDMNVVVYDPELVEAVAWRMAERDGFSHGRGPVHVYVQDIMEILTALDAERERRASEGSCSGVSG